MSPDERKQATAEIRDELVRMLVQVELAHRLVHDRFLDEENRVRSLIERTDELAVRLEVDEVDAF